MTECDKWSNNQIEILLKCLSIVDDGDPDDVHDALVEFLNSTSWDLLDNLEKIGHKIEWNCCSDWNDIKPNRKKNEQ